MKKARFIQTASIVAAAALSLSALAGCGGNGDAGSSSSSSKGLDASFEYAKTQVSSYSSQQSYLSSLFADEAFSRAGAASVMLDGKTAKEDLEKAARYLFLDDVTVADEKGVIVASLTEDEVGKSIKDLGEKAQFNRVVKGIVPKAMADPTAVEGTNDYKVMAAVNRADGSGAVIVSFTSSTYADVKGETVANRCGVNTVVLKDDMIISTTLDKAEKGGNLDSLGVKDADIENGSFKMTVGEASYQCKGAQIDNFVVISAEPV